MEATSHQRRQTSQTIAATELASIILKILFFFFLLDE